MLRYRAVLVLVALAAVIAMMLPPSTLARTNTKDKITVFLHGFNGQRLPAPDWRELMLDMRANGFARQFYAVRFLSADSECDLSGIPNAFNVGLFRFGAHTGPYGHEGTSHDNNTDIRHLAWHFANWADAYIPDDPPIDVVAHSMGSLIARFALGKQAIFIRPALNLEDVVTLGTPHGGVNFASWTGTLRGSQWSPIPTSSGGWRNTHRIPRGPTGQSGRSSAVLRTWSCRRHRNEHAGRRARWGVRTAPVADRPRRVHARGPESRCKRLR